jgi:hypothetical protein
MLKWIQCGLDLTQNRDEWHAVVLLLMNIWVTQNAENQRYIDSVSVHTAMEQNE